MKISNYYSFGLARTAEGQLIQINRNDSGITGFQQAEAKKMGHIKTRLYLFLTLSGLAGKESIRSLIQARKMYQQLEGWSYSLDGQPPVSEERLRLGEAVHIDVYGCKPIKTYH
jgi:hypothetical protein